MRLIGISVSVPSAATTIAFLGCRPISFFSEAVVSPFSLLFERAPQQDEGDDHRRSFEIDVGFHSRESQNSGKRG